MYTMKKASPNASPIIKGQQSSFARLPVDKSSLLDILSLVRPANSTGEQVMIKYITDHLTALGVEYIIDSYGNISVNLLPTNETASRVMFTAHTDTVHRNTDTTRHTQKLVYLDDKHEIVGLPIDSESSCLGADDGTGCWVLLRLIEAKIPALYVFFRDEEIGGLGSEHYRADKNNENLLESLTHCISFDRKGYNDIITEQWVGQCASEAWAISFANQLNAIDATISLSPNVGTFTDSANFTDIIAECTNISIGYDKQHTAQETQDVAFADKLVQALLQIDWLSQPSHRNPADSTPAHLTRYSYKYDYFDYLDDNLDDSLDASLAEHIYYLEQLGTTYAEDLVFNNPHTAIELLTYLTRGY